MSYLHTFRMAVVACAAAGAAWAQSSGGISNLSAQPNSLPTGLGTQVALTCSITDPAVLADSVLVQRLDGTGNVTGTLGTMHDDGLQGDAQARDGIFTARLNMYETAPGIVRLRVSAAIQGSARRTLSPVLEVQVTGTATTIQILSPARDSYLSLSPVQVQGQIGDPSLTVVVNGIVAAKAGNNFSASVPLIEGTNTLTAVASTAGGSTGSSSVQVFLDTTPPRVTVTSPTDGSHTTNAAVGVTGIVNDIVVGTVNPLQATVMVNGVPAQVANRTFALSSLPLVVGVNSIRTEGRDRAGNTFVQTISVTRDALAPGTPTIRALSGDSQSGRIGTQLPAPLVVQLMNALNQPAANVQVTFRVAESNGLVSGLPAAVANTDGQGKAQVLYTLGSRAGAGSNRVEAFATGFQGTVVFTASAQNGPSAKIVVDSGLNQSGPVNQALPFPFVAVMTDSGNNRLGGVPVTFSVRTGGGNINGLTTYSTVSDSDGRVQATLTLGLEEGASNNLVEANFAGNTGAPAAFAASALTPGRADQTTISGVVLDNSNQPIPNVAIRLFRLGQGQANVQPVQLGTPVSTDAQGAFRMTNAPVGIMKLMADGSTAAPNGAWPTLEYDLLTTAGRDNSVGTPIYLPRLDQVNRLCVSQTTGGTLTLPQVPGFSLTVAAGSATFPGGSRSGCISVTPVNPDKVPMAPGFGQQPRFVVTIQPVGTLFNPPARIQIPNVDGLAPRSKTEMYSYDHDLASFVAIGTGTVSADASVIASDPGVGVLKAGWHCGGDPNANGTVADCPTCKWCQGNTCVPDPAQANRQCDDDACKQCVNGSCSNKTDPASPFNANSVALNGPIAGSIPLGPDVWGFTYPESITVSKTARCDGGKWSCVLTGLTGNYSEQVRLLPGVREVTGPTGNTTATNFCAQVTDLNRLTLGANNWFMLAAVRAHEDVHLSRFRPALVVAAPTIEATFTALSTPTARGKTQAQAITEIMALPAFAAAITAGQRTWLNEVLTLVANDHAGGTGPTYVAERAVINPMVTAICTAARTNAWGACGACPP